MKKIITMVGTSIFENYLEKQKNSDIRNYIEDIKDKPLSERGVYEDEIKEIKRQLKEYINTKRREEDLINISAEIKSLSKLRELSRNNLEVYLLTSDTLLGELAGEILEEVLKEKLHFEVQNRKTINCLQVKDFNEFKKGLGNLISEVYSIAQGYWDNVIINITGGFKATIPYLTILAQLNQCPMYYIFEETDTLIEIPNIPLSKNWLNWEKFIDYEDWLEKLNKGIDDEATYYELINSDFYKEYSFLVWQEEGMAELNPIGKIIFEKYREKVFSFKATEEVERIIKNNRVINELFKRLFSREEIRKSKTEQKKGHYVFDAGNNPYRIFYREVNNEIIVYKVFSNHDEYKRYLDNTPYSENLLSNANKLIKIIREE